MRDAVLESKQAREREIKEHLWGILNAIVLKVSNGPAEGLNSRIKMIKAVSYTHLTLPTSDLV